MRIIRCLLLVMGIWFFLLSPLTAAEPDEKTTQLLKTFVSEFVEVQPGKHPFPDALHVPATGDRQSQRIAMPASFSISRYEVPQNLYEAVMGRNPSRWKGPRNSVEMMSWRDAEQFCRRVTELLHSSQLLAADEVIRLPTEVEWEYCCRCGTQTLYSFGDRTRRATDPPQKNSILDEYAWYSGNAAGNDPPVGALKPNPWGLYDMHGYLWEMTSSPWTPERSTAPIREDERDKPDAKIVLRGGSWKDPAEKLTSGFRRAAAVTLQDDAIGFRCVRDRQPRVKRSDVGR